MIRAGSKPVVGARLGELRVKEMRLGDTLIWDDATRLLLRPDGTNNELFLYITVPSGGIVNVDWGDGGDPTVLEGPSSDQAISHQYEGTEERLLTIRSDGQYWTPGIQTFFPMNLVEVFDSGSGMVKGCWLDGAQASYDRLVFGNDDFIEIGIAEGPTTMGDVSGGGVTTLHIPASVTSVSGGTGEDVQSFTMAAGNTSFSLRNGMLCSYDGSTLFRVPGKMAEAVTVPDCVRTVNAHAFYYSHMQSITIPSTVSLVKRGAVYYSMAERLEIAATELEQNAVYSRSGGVILDAVWIRDTVSTVAEKAFYNIGTSGVTIYCEADEKPAGWHADWNLSGSTRYPVVWGQKTRPW